jgi:4-hydroxybutyrate CoA-transferase
MDFIGAPLYGAVNLFGLSLRRRGEVLIGIAHPDFRAELRSALAEARHFVVRVTGASR